MNNYGTGTASSRRFLFPTFCPTSSSRYKISNRSDRVPHEMSNEHEECFCDPLSACVSFFSRNHGFLVKVVYLFLHEFFIKVGYTYTQKYRKCNVIRVREVWQMARQTSGIRDRW